MRGVAAEEVNDGAVAFAVERGKGVDEGGENDSADGGLGPWGVEAGEHVFLHVHGSGEVEGYESAGKA